MKDQKLNPSEWWTFIDYVRIVRSKLKSATSVFEQTELDSEIYYCYTNGWAIDKAIDFVSEKINVRIKTNFLERLLKLNLR